MKEDVISNLSDKLMMLSERLDTIERKSNNNSAYTIFQSSISEFKNNYTWKI